jgi:hypothetical protein
MSMDDRDDPGADTAMFRAYVEEGTGGPPASPPAANRTVLIAVGVALAVIVLLLVFLVAS